MIGALSAVLEGIRPSELAPITQNSLIAYFPQALLRGSNFLSSSYHDVPQDQPELIRELLLAELRILPNDKRPAQRKSLKTTAASLLAHLPEAEDIQA